MSDFSLNPMDASVLNIFATSIINYFTKTTGHPAEMGTPFLGHEDEILALDFSAVIGISGTYRGNIYYTAPRPKMQALLAILGEDDYSDNLCGELVGEITNTISGNAREELGGGFMISTPFLLAGSNISVRAAQGAPCFILPIEWNSFCSRILITLLKTDTTANP